MKQEKTTIVAERPIVRGTAVGGQYISPTDLFTTRAGRDAVRRAIQPLEINRSKSDLISGGKPKKQG